MSEWLKLVTLGWFWIPLHFPDQNPVTCGGPSFQLILRFPLRGLRVQAFIYVFGHCRIKKESIDHVYLCLLVCTLRFVHSERLKQIAPSGINRALCIVFYWVHVLPYVAATSVTEKENIPVCYRKTRPFSQTKIKWKSHISPVKLPHKWHLWTLCDVVSFTLSIGEILAVPVQKKEKKAMKWTKTAKVMKKNEE